MYIWQIHSTACGGHKLVSIYAGEIDRGQNPGTSPAILFSYSCKKHPRGGPRRGRAAAVAACPRFALMS